MDNDKKIKAAAFIIVLFLMVAMGIIYIFCELYTESEIQGEVNESALKFKEEYMSINGKQNSNGVNYRLLEIGDDNPFIYSTDEEIVERIDNKESFVVYFGFNTCPWCRSVLSSMIKAAKEKNIEKIYYVDVKSIRDVYELNDSNEAVRTKDGTKGYYELLNRLSSVLDDYSPLSYTTKKGKEKKVVINEKRIYAPNVVVVKNGEAVSMEEGIVESLTDPYMELSNEMQCEMKEKFICLFDLIVEENNTCSMESKC